MGLSEFLIIEVIIDNLYYKMKVRSLFGKRDSHKKELERVHISLIPKGMEVTGKLNTNGSMRIDGKVEGEIFASSGEVVVGSSGYLSGKVVAKNLKVFGIVEGDVYISDKLFIDKKGFVEADVKALDLTIEDGGKLKGYCEIGKASE